MIMFYPSMQVNVPWPFSTSKLLAFSLLKTKCKDFVKVLHVFVVSEGSEFTPPQKLVNQSIKRDKIGIWNSNWQHLHTILTLW